MSSGWVAIPHAATAAVRGPLGRGAVLDLYSRAHQMGYAPMVITDRELAQEWGVNRHEVWKILDQLDAAGCLTLERAEPGTRKPSRVTVHPAVSTTTGQTPGQNRGQNERPPKLDIEKTRPDARPDPGPSRAEEDARARRDQTTPDPDVVVGAPAEGELAAAVEELLQLQASSGEPVTPKDRRVLRGELAGGLPTERARSLWAWSGLSRDGQAQTCRANGWRHWRGLLGGPQAAVRLELAAAWEAAGRPAALATSPPPRQGRGRAHRGPTPIYSPPPEPAEPPLDPRLTEAALRGAALTGCIKHPDPDFETWLACSACSSAWSSHLKHLAQTQETL